MELTYAEAEELIDDLVQKGFFINSEKRPCFKRKAKIKGAHSRKREGNIIVMITPAEKAKIDALAGLIKWKVKDGMQRWMLKRFGIKKAMTSHDAFMVIEGLKGMFENQMKKLYGEFWFKRDFSDDVDIKTYIREHF